MDTIKNIGTVLGLLGMAALIISILVLGVPLPDWTFFILLSP